MAKKKTTAVMDDEKSRDGVPHGVEKIKIGDILIMLFIGILSLTCITPFIHLLAKSVSSSNAVMAKEVYFVAKGFNISMYETIFKDGQLIHAMFYSVYMTMIFTVLGLVVCTCAAYPLSKKRLKGRTFFSFILMIPMYFSAGLIPTYLLYKDLNLLDSMWVLILPLIFSPYNMLIMRSFFQSSIPDSLEESAFLDGATNFQILFRIVLPLSKSIIATLLLFYAVGRWNAFADAQYYITTKSLKPIQLLLSDMVRNAADSATSLAEGSAATNTPEIYQAAAIMFASVPILCIYPFVQKYFVKGVMVGAVKG